MYQACVKGRSGAHAEAHLRHVLGVYLLSDEDGFAYRSLASAMKPSEM